MRAKIVEFDGWFYAYMELPFLFFWKRFYPLTTKDDFGYDCVDGFESRAEAIEALKKQKALLKPKSLNTTYLEI